jgi:hypothetical protein
MPENHELLPPEVLTCNLWVLSAAQGAPEARQAWYQPNGTRLPVVEAFQQKLASRLDPQAGLEAGVGKPGKSLYPKGISNRQSGKYATKNIPGSGYAHPIPHYILLPLYAWGVGEWDLDAVRPLMLKEHPTVGFSLEEACLAERVSVLDSQGAIADSLISKLRSAGCKVERITSDGTIIAL